MQSILSRLSSYEYIQIVMFSDDMILNQPVEEWPVCECLIAFYSDGFPLDKAIAYVELRKPMVFNDLQEQYSLMDRCVCVGVCGCARAPACGECGCDLSCVCADERCMRS